MSYLRGFIAGLAGAWLLPLVSEAIPEGLFDPQLEQKEAQFYRIETVAAPTNIVMEVGGMGFLPDGTLMLCTRRGEVWSLHDGQWKRFASGLDEPLGLCVISSNQI